MRIDEISTDKQNSLEIKKIEKTHFKGDILKDEKNQKKDIHKRKNTQRQFDEYLDEEQKKLEQKGKEKQNKEKQNNQAQKEYERQQISSIARRKILEKQLKVEINHNIIRESSENETQENNENNIEIEPGDN